MTKRTERTDCYLILLIARLEVFTTPVSGILVGRMTAVLTLTFRDKNLQRAPALDKS